MTIHFGTDGWRAVISDTFTFSNLRQLTQAIADAVASDQSGQNSYQCKKCGLLVKSKDIPHSFNCVAEGNHHWVKIQSEPNPGS